MSDETEIETGLHQLGQMARAASTDFQNLSNVVKAWGRSNPLPKSFVVDLKQARQLLKDSGNNVEAVKKSLQGAGVAGRDLSMLMRQLNNDVDKARRGALGFESVWQRIFSPRSVAYAAHAMQAVSGGFSVMKSMMGGPLGMASNVIGRGIDLGKDLLDSVVEAAEFRQNALTGMTYMLGGDSEKARALFADAQKLAQETPLDTDKVIGGIKTFLTQGFSADQSKFLYKVVADQASKFLDQPEMEKNVVSAFSRLQGRGYATGEDLESLRVAGFRGADIMKQLKVQKGMDKLFTGKHALTGKESETEFFKKIREVLGTGMVGKGTMLNAAIGSLYEGKELSSTEGPGALAKKFGGESLTGALSNLKNAFPDLLRSMELVKTKGFKALIGGVDESGKSVEGFIPKLSRIIMNSDVLKKTIEGLIDSFLGGFSNIKDVDIENMISTIGTLAKEVIKFFQAAWGWLDKLLHAQPGEFLENVKDILVDVGTYIGQGILKGVQYGVKAAIGIETPKVSSDLRSFTRDIRTVSGTVAEEEEDETPAWAAGLNNSQHGGGIGTTGLMNLDVPHFAQGGHVSSPTLAVVGEGGEGETIIPDSKLGRMGNISISAPVQLIYAGSADPDSLEAALSPVMMRLAQNMVQRIALEMG